MARLPGPADLGGVRIAESGRPIATVDLSAPGKAMEGFGASVANAGSRMFDMAEQISRRTSEDETLKATSDWLQKKTKLDEDRDNLTDAEEADKFKPNYSTALGESANLISDPKRREQFMLRHAPTVTGSEVAVNNKSFELRKDSDVAAHLERLKSLEQTTLAAKDPETRKQAIETANASVDALMNKGYIDETTAFGMKQKWAEGYASRALSMLPPEQRIVALSGNVSTNDRTKAAYNYFVSQGWAPHQAAGIVGNLMQESSLRTHANNPGDGKDGSDSIGIGQWNSDRAIRLKQFAAKEGKDWRDFGVQLAFVQNELMTTEGSAGARLKAAGNVRDATAAMVMYERPKGSNLGAENADGWGNRLRHAQTFHATYGGGEPVAPAKGSELTKYIAPDQQQAMLAQARDQRAAEIRKAENDARIETANVNSLVRDDIVSIQQTGGGLPADKLPRERVVAALGEQGAAEWETVRTREKKVFDATDGIPLAPDNEIDARVEQLKPQSGAVGYADDAKAYELARKKADQIKSLRRVDPAQAATAFPDVRAATPSDLSFDKPETYKPLIKARMAAQEAMRIPEDNRIPITKTEALTLWEPIRLASDLDRKDVIVDTIKQIDKMTGGDEDLSDRALQYVLAQGRADKETRKITAAIMRKISKNEIPQPEDLKQLDAARKTAAMDDAVKQFYGIANDYANLGIATPDMQEALTGGKPKFPPGVMDEARRILWSDPSPKRRAQYDATFGEGAAAKSLLMRPQNYDAEKAKINPPEQPIDIKDIQRRLRRRPEPPPEPMAAQPAPAAPAPSQNNSILEMLLRSMGDDSKAKIAADLADKQLKARRKPDAFEIQRDENGRAIRYIPQYNEAK